MQVSIFHPSCTTHQTYKMRCAETEELLHRANYRCELCGGPPGKKPLAIDHDHEVGWDAVRGVLCPKCNQGHMARIDDGRRPIDEATAQYLRNAWHLVRSGRKLTYDPIVTVKPHELSQADMAELVRVQKTAAFQSRRGLNPPKFEHPGLAACIAANDYRQVLHLLRQAQLHPSPLPRW